MGLPAKTSELNASAARHTTIVHFTFVMRGTNREPADWAVIVMSDWDNRMPMSPVSAAV
jgi:hypothetical protein